MTTTSAPTEIPLAAEADIVAVRQVVRTLAVAAGFSLVDQTKLVTAASELARNTLIHGGGGVVRVESRATRAATTVIAAFIDEGAGIPDIERALTDGFTTIGGLGLGLGGARRLVDFFRIESSESGTTVWIATTGGTAR